MSHVIDTFRVLITLIAATLFSISAGCGWVDSTGNQADFILLGATGQADESVIGLSEESPKLLDLQQFSNEEGDILQVINWQRTQEGKLAECAGILDSTITADSLYDACPADLEDCEMYILETPDASDAAYSLVPPRLSLPVGLRYDWEFQSADGSIETHQISFCLNADNEAPVAINDSFSVTEAGTLVIDGFQFDDRCDTFAGNTSLLENDKDDGDRRYGCLRTELLEAPRWARNNFDNSFTSGGGFTYQHDPAIGNTEDRFVYRLFDGEFFSNAATVVISVGNNQLQPEANDDSYDVRRNSTGNIFYPMSNDVDPEAVDIDLIRIESAPDQGGDAEIIGTNIIRYTPRRNFRGIETMVYTIINASGFEDSATISIQVR